ncbi:hypothetical protein L4C34_03515 [Vibrio profundum]|uniref:hypothetical protein n=1 Tax=Vibrio profundum TaxID=2910247 RepID=UPI003D12B8E3
MRPLQQLNMLIIGGAALVAFAVLNKAYRAADEFAAEATQPAGQVLSDLFAKFNGWEPVELAPLMIRDFYLTDKYKLTDDAYRVLWKVEQYRPLLIELFGGGRGPLKPKYRPLINVEITKDNIRHA